MNVDDLILVSVDDHLIEPAHMFEGRVPKKYEDSAPRFVRREDATMAWRYEGQEILNAMRHFQYDPFAHIPRERATVSALRSAAVDWDVSIKSVRHLRPATASLERAF